jgi:hypothetical protein
MAELHLLNASHHSQTQLPGLQMSGGRLRWSEDHILPFGDANSVF